MSIALAALSVATAQPALDRPDYGLEQNWLCLPGEDDVCSRPVAAHRLEPTGWGARQISRPDPAAPIDCFYVYPTVSSDSGMNSDLVPGNGEEKLFAQVQFARFSSVCKPFAPMYRQMTTSSIALAATGADMTQFLEIAYADVRNAWRDYMANRNHGRPFVLIGHSQGSIMLERLIAEEIDGKPAQKQMVRALLPGWNVTVRQGERTGGSFRSVPACASADDTGCVVSWSTYGAGTAPGASAIFGYAQAPNRQPICNLTEALGAKKGNWAALDGFYFAKSSYPVKGGPVRWSSKGPPPGNYATSENLVQGRCITDGPRGYLQVRLVRDEGDTRTDRIGGEVGMGGFFLPGWGKHLMDMQIAQDDLIAMVDRLGDETRPD
ncbi:DUF3089 domain-containing protein [Sphingomicrobium sp. XHP0235]|uniref:DUF3089 domain-containing protein n=1 Tax=Sphingomicrobium aquimarinum TaxID=3133971 RepID=UPI0031FF21DE